jgi:hypothetical protein
MGKPNAKHNNETKKKIFETSYEHLPGFKRKQKPKEPEKKEGTVDVWLDFFKKYGEQQEMSAAKKAKTPPAIKREDKRDTAKLTITLNVEQAYVLMHAMEFYARIHIGQFDHLEWAFISHDLRRDFIWRDQDKRDELRRLLNAARDIVFPELVHMGSNASHGIHSTDIVEGAHDAWDIYQSVRRTLAFHRNPNPEGIERWRVCYDKPFGVSKRNPLPVVAMVPGGIEND